jgi:hypothetical protein
MAAGGRECAGNMGKYGFCNGPGAVNSLSSLARHPFAGVLLLSGVGALAAT